MAEDGVTIDTSDLERKLGGASDKAVAECLRRAETAKLMMVSYAVKNAPYVTGKLKTSVAGAVSQDGDLVRITVGSNTEYAPYVEFGTGRKGSSLYGAHSAPGVAFTARDSWSYQDAGGQWHTSHGSVPHPYLRPALYDQETALRELFAKGLAEVLEQ